VVGTWSPRPRIDRTGVLTSGAMGRGTDVTCVGCYKCFVVKGAV